MSDCCGPDHQPEHLDPDLHEQLRARTRDKALAKGMTVDEMLASFESGPRRAIIPSRD